MLMVKYPSCLVIFLIILSSHLSAQEFLMGGAARISTCGGFFFDSGGEDGAYAANESATITICSDGSEGSHVQLRFSAPEIRTGDRLCFFDGENENAPQLSCSSDFLSGSPFIIQATAANTSGCLTVVFESDGSGQGEGWSADINCVTACQSIQAQLVETFPAVVPADTGWIDVCPGQEITLKAEGLYPQDGIVYQHSDQTSRFEWNFGDGTIALGPEVTHQYDESGGYTVQVTITDQFGCINTNFINQRVRVSTQPTFQLGGDVPSEICAGDTVQLNAAVNRLDETKAVSVVPTEGNFQFGGTRADSLALPDGDGNSYKTSISFSDFLPGQTLTEVDDILGICVNIEHSWMRDLEISISCPDGSSIVLHDHRGQTGGPMNLGEPIDFDDREMRPGTGYDYCWTPDAANPTWLDFANDPDNFFVRTLPAGDYQTVDPMEDLLGCPLNGEWTITVTDLWGQDNGYIFSWGIDFNPKIFPNLETFTPELIDYAWEASPYSLFESTDSLAAAPQNAGKARYVFSVTDDFGCRYDTAVALNVLPVTHPQCYSCSENLGPVIDAALCDEEEFAADVSSDAELETALLFETFPDYRFGFSNHPPANPYRSPLEVSSVQPDVLNDPVQQIRSVCLDIETDWTGDLDIQLQAPDGQRLLLSSGNGGDGNNFTNTCFSPTATVPVASGNAPFSGNFQPDGDWSALQNTPIAGTWTLLVSDALGIEEMGRINHWSIEFESTNEITYSWSPPQGLSCTDCPDPVANPTVTTDYKVTATDLYGCIETDTMTIGIPGDAPSVECTVSDDGQITFFWPAVDNRLERRILRNNTPDSDWDLLPDNTSNAVFSNARPREALTLELRSYIGSEPVNCSYEITAATCTFRPCDLEGQLVGEPDPVTCFGDSDGAVTVTASLGDPPYSFFLDGTGAEQSTGQFDGLTAGEHYVLVRDTALCEDTVRFVVPGPDSLQVDAEQVQQGCPGAQRNQVMAGIEGGNGGFSYIWNDGQTTSIAVNLDSFIYAVTVTDAKGCMDTSSIKVEDIPVFNPNVIQSSPSCFGFDDGQLAVNFVEGGLSQDPNDYRFLWSTGDTGRIVSNLPGGLAYTVTVTSGQNCEVITERVLRQPSEISFEITAQEALCASDPLGSATVTNITGDNDEFTFQWDGSAGNQMTATASNLRPGTYTVTITDEDGCTKSGSITLDPPSEIELAVDKEDNLCYGDQDGRIEVTPSGGIPEYDFQWSTGATGSSLTGLPAGTYTLSLTDKNGCEVVEEITIEAPPLLSVQLEEKDPTCFGFRNGTIMFEVEGGVPPYLYSLDNENFSGANMFVGLEADDYQVYVKDDNGCIWLERVTLEDPPEFTVNAGFDQTIILGDSIQLTADASNGVGGVEFVWTAPYEGTLSCAECARPIAKPINTITYELYGIDSLGCENNDFINVNVDKPRIVEVPTGFTPNGDGLNDRLLVHGRNGTRVTLFRVYDRWGELLYEQSSFMVNDPDTGWDGNFRGQPMNGGVYIWYLEVEYIDGEKDALKGQTTLIR